MRRAKVARKTKETDINLELNLDGTGIYRISTSIPFFDHMLSLMCKHALLDMKLKAKGDIEIDFHHTVEDIGIVLGTALKKALNTMKGISRYGAATVPMDESLASVALDISGRPHLVYKVAFSKKSKMKVFDPDLLEDFFQAFISHAGVTLHINVQYGRNAHHIIESVFKAFGKALQQAVTINPRIMDIPSTKGRL
jgi:imidazoleglycerol-phosphate dehydratase